jgi:membrane-associated phospholipid phosphatase
MANGLEDPAGSASVQQQPLTAKASPAGWRAWLWALLHSGRRTLGELGLILVAGFATGLFALYAFAQMADEVMEQETMRLDGAALSWLQHFASPTLKTLATAVSFMGSEAVTILLLVLLVWLGLQRRWGAAIGLLLVTAGAQLLNSVLKDLFQRARPSPVTSVLFDAQAFSFPSGHAMVSAAFYLYLAYLGWQLVRGWPRLLLAGSLVLLVLLIGLSRMFLGVHYLTDVIAGYIAGFIWTDTVIIAGHLLGRVRRPRESERDARGSRVEATQS